MTREVTGSSLGLVDEGGDDTTTVTDTDLHGDADTALGRSTNVVAVPHDHDGDGGVDTTGGEEGSDVLCGWDLGGDQEDVADDCSSDEADQEAVRFVLGMWQYFISEMNLKLTFHAFRFCH